MLYSWITAELATNTPADQRSVLYSILSGEEILQQWLAKHPEVKLRHEKMKQNSVQQANTPPT